MSSTNIQSTALNPATVPFTPPVQRTSCCGRITTLPIIGHIVRAIIWLAKKIFPCCFSQVRPLSSADSTSQNNPKGKLSIPGPTSTATQIQTPIVPPAIPSTTKKQDTIPPTIPNTIAPIVQIQNPPSVSSKTNKTIDIKRIHKLPGVLSAMILQDVNCRDLRAFNVAVSSKARNPTLDQAQKALKQQENTLQQLLQGIVDESRWGQASGFEYSDEPWKNIAVEDMIWLVRVHLLACYLPRCLPQVSAIAANNPYSKCLALLKQRKEIDTHLASIREIDCDKDFPEAIYLLVNLEKITMTNLGSNRAPDLSRFSKLKYVNFAGNKLTTSPDVTKNPLLEYLNLGCNFLTRPPDLSQNPNLISLDLMCNEVTTVDVTNNPKLTRLQMFDCKLTAIPDLSKNSQLTACTLTNNPLSPDEKLKFEALQIGRRGFFV